jgi:hypothetical protein
VYPQAGEGNGTADALAPAEGGGRSWNRSAAIAPADARVPAHAVPALR